MLFFRLVVLIQFQVIKTLENSDSIKFTANTIQFHCILLYIEKEGREERFLRFLDVEGNTAEQLAQISIDFLKEKAIISKTVVGKVMTMSAT